MVNTSKISVAFGGMEGGAPAFPYPKLGGMARIRFPPFFMPRENQRQTGGGGGGGGLAWDICNALFPSLDSFPSSNCDPKHFVGVQVSVELCTNSVVGFKPASVFDTAQITCTDILQEVKNECAGIESESIPFLSQPLSPQKRWIVGPKCRVWLGPRGWQIG